MKDKTMGFDLTKGEVEILREHYKDRIYQTIRDFDEDLHYQTVKDVKRFINGLSHLIEDYDKYNFE